MCPSCGYDNVPGVEECANCTQDLTHIDASAPPIDPYERSLLRDDIRLLNPVSPVSIGLNTTVREAIQTMIDKRVGALVVTDAPGMLVGIFTERDVLMRIAGLEENYDHLPVSQFMTRNPTTIHFHDKLAYALHLMDGGDYRHLPVMQKGKPAGVISVRDVLRYLTELCNEKPR
jgi:CBS domain-containing protein